MKTLANLTAPGSNRETKRLGRGQGSGQGKTGGKGHKGQKARKGRGPAPGFEGGQTPLYRRLPKRGFRRRSSKLRYNVIQVSSLEIFADKVTIDKALLAEKGLLTSVKAPIKIIGCGELSRSLTLKVDKVSAGAQAVIEKAGGSLVVPAVKVKTKKMMKK